jgi:hypothetical protein
MEAAQVKHGTAYNEPPVTPLTRTTPLREAPVINLFLPVSCHAECPGAKTTKLNHEYGRRRIFCW